MDGRDIGTNVLPEADLKIYLTADVKVRAQRRYLELQRKGVESDIKEIEEDIMERDLRDMQRKIAPLKKAEEGPNGGKGADYPPVVPYVAEAAGSGDRSYLYGGRALYGKLGSPVCRPRKVEALGL